MRTRHKLFRSLTLTIGALILLVMITMLSFPDLLRMMEAKEFSNPAIDSLEAETIAWALPDTMYPSALLLDFVIRVYDTITPGTIADTSDKYTLSDGVFTFRGGPFRDHPNRGRITGTPASIATDWEYRTGFDTILTSFGRWGGGTGWTGQPLLVSWPDEAKKRFSELPDSVLYALPAQEVIFGSLCAKVYFLDYETGTPTRKPLETHNPVKGTISLDPAMNGNLYVGQGIPNMQPFGALVFNLFSHRQTQFIPGADPFSGRGWGAFDSSPIAVGEFLFWPGENGLLYKFLRKPDTLILHSTLRYRVNGASSPGIESSMSVFHHYGYIGDNHGNIVCINLNTMKPVWHYNQGDDTDASPVLVLDKGRPLLYTGCEVDRQGKKGVSRFSCLDALNGSLQWQQSIPCISVSRETKTYNGGMLATPLSGEGNCRHLIFSNFAQVDSTQKGDLIAFDKHTGEIRYRTRLDAYSWSSPVPFYNENDELYILTGDLTGMVYLIEGISGKILFRQQVGQNFESSPLVNGNSVIFGSRGRSIYKLTIQCDLPS
jgi:outer membrane protein assembly factor BamB